MHLEICAIHPFTHNPTIHIRNTTQDNPGNAHECGKDSYYHIMLVHPFHKTTKKNGHNFNFNSIKNWLIVIPYFSKPVLTRNYLEMRDWACPLSNKFSLSIVQVEIFLVVLLLWFRCKAKCKYELLCKKSDIGIYSEVKSKLMSASEHQTLYVFCDIFIWLQNFWHMTCITHGSNLWKILFSFDW